MQFLNVLNLVWLKQLLSKAGMKQIKNLYLYFQCEGTP